MNVTFACRHCDRTQRVVVPEDAGQLACQSCGYRWQIPDGALQDGQVHRCLVCPSDDLFVRKNFSQRLGMLIIVIGFALSTVAWAYHRPIWTFAILFAFALVDLLLYICVGNLLQCYRCRSEYRDLEGIEQHEAFSLEKHERFRQQAARIAQASSPGPAPRPSPDDSTAASR